MKRSPLQHIQTGKPVTEHDYFFPRASISRIQSFAIGLLFCLLLPGQFANAQIKINEFLAYNASSGLDTTTNNFSDWIEIYNANHFSVNLGGYFLTDNLADTMKWQIPPNTVVGGYGFLLVWADGTGTGMHTNFKLSSDGEEIGLYNQSKVLVDSLVYIPQQTDISYGRKPDGDDSWYYFDNPTAGASNTSPGFSTYTRSDPPLFSIPGGFYSGYQEVELSSTLPGSVIHYTLNGQEPSASSPSYQSPITIDSTTVVRAKVLSDGMVSSHVVTHTYFIDVAKDLPVFSLVCDSLFLWDTAGGIYYNSAIDQERIGNIEYFENELPILNQSVGIQIHGFVARYLPQKIFGLYAGNKYGNTSFSHKFFPEKDIFSFSTFFLRNGGFPENASTMLRDGLMQNLVVGKVDLDYMAYRPAVVYLNGKYWGLYNIREKQNNDYLAANRNIDPANIDYIENYYLDVIEGDANHFINFMDFITNNDISEPANFDHVRDLIDVDNLLDYMITEMYYANTDWPGANQKFWRPKEEGGKWQWILTDVEFGFGMEADYDHNTVEFALAEDGTSWANPPEATYMFRRLLENAWFRNEFIQRFAAHLNISYKPETVIARIDSFSNNVSNEMPLQISRWKDEVWESSWGTNYHVIESMELWEAEIEKMRQFALLRASYNRQHLIDKFGLDGTMVMTSHAQGGHILVNSVRLAEGEHSGTYFKNIPLQLEAVPGPGMIFQHWMWNDSIIGEQKITLSPGDDIDITAVFAPSGSYFLPAFITADITLVAEGQPYLGTTDIFILPGRVLTLEPGVEIHMSDSCCINVLGGLVVNGTPDDRCTIRPNEMIKAVRWGAICIQDATGPVKLNHLDLIDASTGRNKIIQKAAISSFGSDVNLDGVSITGADFPFYSEYGNITILNSTLTSDKTCDMINVKYASSALVESCVIKGNQYPDTDGIDYDQIENGIIRNNIISGFSGFNSDGIDIGEGATGILVENNRILNCSDKGISVGQASTAIIRRNLIFNCNLGVGVKDSLAHAYIDQNTFYQNNYAVACFEKNWGAGGGSADVVNSILSECRVSPFLVDELSTLGVTYSLSDTEPLEGTGNILNDPKFKDPMIMNFELKDSSPCIDAGDPSSPQDPDGSPADMGAYFVFQSPETLPIVINEINYNSHPDFNSGDWIEIYNNTDRSIDMSGWIFKDSKDEHTYRFPQKFTLEKDAYLVLCNNLDSFASVYPTTWNIRGPFGFGLKREDEALRLFDPGMNLVDMVEYTNDDPWPSEPDGEGYTLQLVDPSLDNNLAESWQASEDMFGNPGSGNFISAVHDIRTESGIHIFPNPARHVINIELKDVRGDNMELEVIDLYGRVIYKNDYKVGSENAAVAVDVSCFHAGIYVLRFASGSKTGSVKFIIR